MPPKLTSKNIFDVVFAPLPADAFIDTGPASLREELMLEAAGLSSSSSSADHSGRGGSSSYRRHLLPASVVSGNAGGHGKSSSSSAAAAGGSSGGAKAGQSAAARSARSLLEEDEDDLLRDNDGGNDDASAVAPPAYDASAPAGTGASTAKAAQHPHKARSADPPKPSSLFRRVDDGEEAAVGVVRAPPRRHGAAPALDASGRGGTADALGSGADLAIQMDAEDDAVREATKYARHLSTAEADGDSGVSGSTERATAAAAVTGEGAGGQSSGHGTAGALADELAEGATARGQQQAGGAATSTAAAANAPLGGVSPAAPYATQRRGPLTAAEQLALMPPGLDHVYTGSCVTYRHPKGFGFVSPDLGGPDVYFVNDAITLSFTRLALRAFYIKNEMPVPASVAMAYRAPPAAELPAVAEEASGALPGQEKTAEGEAEEEKDETTADSGKEGSNEGPQPASTEAVQKADEAEEAKGTADGAPPQPPSHSAVAATEEEEEETATTAGVLGDAPPLPLPSPLTTASALHQNLPSVFAGMGGPAAMAAAAGMDIGDCVSIPPTTPQELQYAEAAAALLTPATAQLLQHQINQGFTGGLRVGERLSFVVTRNQAGRGGNGRLLRAEWVRGLPTAAYAMPVEQAWFSPMFVGAVGRKATGHPSPYGSRHRTPHPAEVAPVGGGSVVDIATAAALPAAAGGGDGGQGSTALVRYTGCVRTYDAEDQRGYLRCDEIDPSGGVTPDVVFYAHAVLWDTARCPPLKRQVQESMRVAYSVCATERNGKYVATLITTVDGEAFCEENITYADNVQPYYMAEGSRRRGREDHHSSNMHGGGRGGGGGGGGGGNADGGNIGGDSGQHSNNNSSNNASGGNSNAGGGGGGDRKRAKVADEDLLLFEEDDYPFM